MTHAIIMLLVTVAMLGAPLVIISFINWSVYKRFPRPIFHAFSWLYPFRSEACPGVLLASAIRANPAAFTVSGVYDTISGELAGKRISVVIDGMKEGRARVTIGDLHGIPVTAWGDNRLWRAFKMLKRRANAKASTRANTENRDKFLQGTLLAAQVVSEGLRLEAPNVVDPLQARLDFEIKSRYLVARRVESEMSEKMLLTLTPERRM